MFLCCFKIKEQKKNQNSPGLTIYFPLADNLWFKNIVKMDSTWKKREIKESKG